MTAAKRGRPPKVTATADLSDEDTEGRILAVIDKGVTAIEQEMTILTSGGGNIEPITKLATESGVLLGHVRRATEARRQAAKRLSWPLVVEFLRQQSEDERDHHLAEFAIEGKAPAKQVSPLQ